MYIHHKEWIMSYKTILFDWDGCLVQSLDAWQDACIQALSEFGVIAEPTEVAPLLGSGRIAKHFGILQAEACAERIRALAAARLQYPTLYPGVHEAVRLLAMQMNLAVVSSGRSHILTHGLKHTGLHKYFALILDGESVIQKKPHPEGIFKALEALNCKPTEAVMIGDSINDIGAAQAAGIDSLLFYPPEHKKFYTKTLFKTTPPTGVFTHFSELRRLVT